MVHQSGNKIIQSDSDLISFQAKPYLITSLTLPSPSPKDCPTSPAASQTTPLKWRLVAKESAVKGNAQHLGPRFVPRGSALTVILSSMKKIPNANKEEGQLQLCQGLIWRGAPVMGAELGSTRVVVTTQTA